MIDELGRASSCLAGPLELAPGDSLRFNCHAEVTPERVAELGVPLPTAPLRFANEAFTAEMCIMGVTATGKFDGAF